ncbi:hypothetical protein NDU88_006910 [Pleurodeles waltl]|uniref:Uncharacterized protein n=1 Tax=Pleurodeles waltl TaxID=8319 RepID=A0AAV7NA06_PLEWA|nr:hypothetical protein NDU88_006910 [Pleurodeles waltl]
MIDLWKSPTVVAKDVSLALKRAHWNYALEQTWVNNGHENLAGQFLNIKCSPSYEKFLDEIHPPFAKRLYLQLRQAGRYAQLANSSRVADFPATFSAGSRSEKYLGGPAGNEAAEVGNPDIRIPENLPIEAGQRAQRAEEGEAAGAGNPEIRVPESLKREEGLRAQSAEETKDAERRDTERANEGNIGEDERELDSDIGEGGPLTSRGNTMEGQEGPKKPELHHVPGGAWLQQVRSCLRNKLRFIVGREEGGGDE